MKRTFFPPIPSTTFPVLLSTTLACNIPPRKLSSTLPRVPNAVKPRIHCALGMRFSADVPLPDDEQKGISHADVAATMNAPKAPARRPVPVTPPFVPGGTTRRVGEVIRRGFDLERIPSSEEKVSAATAA